MCIYSSFLYVHLFRLHHTFSNIKVYNKTAETDLSKMDYEVTLSSENSLFQINDNKIQQIYIRLDNILCRPRDNSNCSLPL